MRNDDGVFHFKLCYPERTEHDFPCNEWIQSSNPLLESTITGFTGIHLTWPKRADGGPFQGLGQSPSNVGNNLMDDTPNDANWWNTVGTISPFGGSIPGPVGTEHITVKKKELYVEYTPSKQNTYLHLIY